MPHLPTVPRRRRLPALLLLAAAALAALTSGCGGGHPATTATTATGAATTAGGGFPVTVSGDAGSSVTVRQAASRVVSLSPAVTEMLFAIGAGPQVVAVDDQSSYPAEAPRTKLSGFRPNAEAVAGYRPDLVLVSSDSNGLVRSLTALKVPVLVLAAPTDLEGAYPQLLGLGRATGHLRQAELVVAQTRRRIVAAVASVPAGRRQGKVYHELDPTYFSVTSRTFIGSLYTRFGLTDIADAAKGAGSDYPQLSAEYVVTSAPDLVVLADGTCCGQSAATFAKRAAFDSVPAVRTGRVITVPDDIASRWGPRTADFAEAVAAALNRP